MQIKTLGLSFLLVVTGLAGCGGGSSGGTFTTSVPSSTKLTDLTPSQATQLCNDLLTFEAKTLNADSCKIAGLLAAEYTGTASPTNAQLQTACTQAYNDCLSADGGLTSTTTCDSSTLNEPSTCEATVGDLQTCTNDQIAAINGIYGPLPSCSALTTANLSTAIASLSSDAGPMEPASCSKFDSTCGSSSTVTAHRVVMQRLQSLKH